MSTAFTVHRVPETSETHIEHAQEVILLQAKALEHFAAAIPTDFDASVEAILAATGRVIISGIGKSGHVARKIAATLSSTGTPALFVHPSEASHGDLGMISEGDICMLLSNSGETSELADLIAYARRFARPLIGVSRKSESSLMRAADLKLLLPDAPEACAIGMAPTTSTTMTMVLGDALAVALMHARGFKPEHFRVLHPGGRLGAQLKTVEQLMHKSDYIPRVNKGATMPEVLVAMTSGGFGVAVVTEEDNTLFGIVTDGDLRRNISDLMSLTAETIATREPVILPPETLAADAVALMNERKITVLLVVSEDKCPVGILHMHDLLRAGVV